MFLDADYRNPVWRASGRHTFPLGFWFRFCLNDWSLTWSRYGPNIVFVSYKLRTHTGKFFPRYLQSTRPVSVQAVYCNISSCNWRQLSRAVHCRQVLASHFLCRLSFFLCCRCPHFRDFVWCLLVPM
jgi:hypothetical protein